MKTRILYIALGASLSLFMGSCSLNDLDNYDGPDAGLKGSIIDQETGELVQQDIIGGSTIKVTEEGYDPVTPRYLNMKCDGTYADEMMFSNKYLVQPDLRNFFPVDEEEIEVKGLTTHDFQVTPYLRIKNLKMEKTGNTVLATFNIQATSTDAVKAIGLYASDQAIVGEPVRQVAVERRINRQVSEDEVFKIGLNIARNKVNFKDNKDYYFRVGAVTSIAGAKFNYAPAQKINVGEVVPEPDPEYYYLDHCDALDGWGSMSPLSLNTTDKKEGKACIEAAVKPGHIVYFQKQFKTPVDSKVGIDNGNLRFDLYVDDVTGFNMQGGDGQIEIGSGGNCDRNELNWIFKSNMKLHTGWNEITLKLSEAGHTGGECNLKAINWIRLYNTNCPHSMTMRIDNIRFFEEY